MSALTFQERRAQGLKARQQLARSAQEALHRKVCPADPLAVLAEAMEGRLPDLLRLKYERMAASPFGFFRGAVPIMAADLAAHPHSGLITQLCGDAHISNLGAYASEDGRSVFDINDFDETIRGPFEWDVKRLATSLLLAGREAKVGRTGRVAAAMAFTASYRQTMHRLSEMPVLDLVRFQIHRLAQAEPMPAIFRQAERSTPQRLLSKLTQSAVSARRSASTRRFRSLPPLLVPLEQDERIVVLDALEQYRATLNPERQHFLAQYTPVDVAFKVVGVGSVALRDYVVYLESYVRPSHADPLFLQVKEEPPSAYARYLPEGVPEHIHQGQRVMNGQRALQLTSDPFLGYTTMQNRDFLVRQLNDHKASLDLALITEESLDAYAVLCGELLARGHARSGDPVSIAAYLGSNHRFDKAIVRFAHSYAEKTEHDWKLLRRNMERMLPRRQGA